MRFNGLAQLQLPATVERIIAGALHPDGRRYLPQLVLRLHDVGPDGSNGLRLSVVDRHHVSIGRDWSGRPVLVALVCALSTVTRRPPPARNGWIAPSSADRPFSDVLIAGTVTAVPVWEAQSSTTDFATIYTEFMLRVGSSTIGVKTSLSADGRLPLQPGAAVELSRSRIDLLRIAAAD